MGRPLWFVHPLKKAFLGRFVAAIRLENGQAVISDACRGCGRCVDVCPQGAIELSIEDGRFVDHVVAHIAALVDLE